MSHHRKSKAGPRPRARPLANVRRETEGDDECGVPSDITPYASDWRRSRSAFPMTDTELKVIAALAMIGLNRIPKSG